MEASRNSLVFRFRRRGVDTFSDWSLVSRLPFGTSGSRSIVLESEKSRLSNDGLPAFYFLMPHRNLCPTHPPQQSCSPIW